MAYNPQVAPWSPQPSDYTAGASRAGAITNVGNSIAQGMNQWYANDKQDTQTRAQVAALLPQFADHLTNPEDKTLVEKFVNHKSNYKDNGYLLGLFSTLKNQQQSNLQNDYLKSQIDDTASQAKLRAIQGTVAQRNMEFLKSIMDSSGQPASAPPPGVNQFAGPQAAPQAPQQSPNPFIYRNPNQLQPMAPAAAPMQAPQPVLAPTTPPPTMKDAMMTLVRSTGQMADPQAVTALFNNQKNAWDKVERPIGYVEGSTTTDKDGIKVTSFHPVSFRNDGSIVREKEPIVMYAGKLPPGQLLDPTTYKPIVNPVMSPDAKVSAAAMLPPSKEQQAEIQKTAQDLNELVIERKQLDNINALDAELNKRRWSKTAGLTGGRWGNVAEQLVGDDSGLRFNAAAAPFFTQMLQNSKGIRTQKEFDKVTGGVPQSDNSPATRRDILENVRDALDNSIALHTNALTSMKAGALPSSAWENAMGKNTQVVHKIFSTPAQLAAAVKAGKLEDGDRITVGGVPGTWHKDK